MSRLDSFIRRLSAQRACLDQAIAALEGRQGPVLELGLGNGRTYDHLRAALGWQRIYVLDRQVAAHPDCIPPEDHMIVGDFDETLPQISQRFAGQVVLAHLDIGSGDKAQSLALAKTLAPHVRRAMAPDGILVTDQPLPPDHLRMLDLPPNVAEGRYFMYAFVPGVAYDQDP